MSSTAFSIRNRHGDVIRGDIHQARGVSSAPVAVICHGFKGFKDWGLFPWAADTLAARGITTLRFNFSLNGVENELEHFTALDRFERNTISRELEDLDDIITAVVEKGVPLDGVDTTRLAVIGHSLGGGVCIVKAASDSRIDAVVCWAGVATFDRWGPQIKKQWRESGRLEITNARTGQIMPMNVAMLEDLESNAEVFDIPAAASAMSQPLLLIHGEQDVSVPIDEAYRIAGAAKGKDVTIRKIPNTDHTFGAVHPFAGDTAALREVLESTGEWLLACFDA
jgi:uncharacterized protein